MGLVNDGFADRLRATAGLIEESLTGLLRSDLVAGGPERLLSAMEYSVLGGGKRLRPFLVLEGARLFGVAAEKAIPAALAIELIHGYSLVHDDLPAMDNDTLRRGRPTVWTAYDDWTAILAGDAIHALAFECLADAKNGLSPEVRLELIQGLGEAAGVRGMVGGQAIDLEADKLGRPAHPDAAHVRQLQVMKTGALIAFSCEAGAIVAGAATDERAALVEYGHQLGYAFQIADDLLDVEGDEQTVGKAVSKDAAANKATLVSLMGIEEARAELTATTAKAKAALDRFGEAARILQDAADFVSQRDR